MIRGTLYGFLIAALTGLCCQVHADPYSAPVVYSDRNINVRSALLDFEQASFHLGDTLHLIMVLEFDQDRIRINNLDETLLTESWRGSTWFAGEGSPRITFDTLENGLVRVEAVYAFRILACPNPGAQCPGGKSYALDDINLGLDLLDDNGRAVSTVEIGFRPSPGFAGIPSALAVRNGRLDSFNLYFPGRAFGLPVPAAINPLPSLLLFIIGLALVIGLFVAPAMRSWLRHRVTRRLGILGKRWEHVLDRLQNGALEDPEFAEGLRVAITWYCYDEFRINPVYWTEAADNTGGDSFQELKKIYLQASLGDTISTGRRKELIDRLTWSFKRD